MRLSPLDSWLRGKDLNVTAGLRPALPIAVGLPSVVGSTFGLWGLSDCRLQSRKPEKTRVHRLPVSSILGG